MHPTTTSISETRVSREKPPADLVQSYDEKLMVRERRHAADVIQRGPGALDGSRVDEIAAWYDGIEMAELDRRITVNRKAVLEDIKMMASALRKEKTP